MRDKTKRLKVWKNILWWISFFLCYLPLFVSIGLGFSYSDNSAGKVSLSICCIVALLLTIINALTKHAIRSTMWILLLGIYVVLDNVMPLLIAMGICTILDEFIISPLYKSVKNRYIINREIDTI